MEDGRFMQPFYHDKIPLCGNQSFTFSDKDYLSRMLIKKSNQILGDEFTKDLDCYKSYHLKQVAREKEVNKEKMATKSPIGTAFSTKCVYLTLKKAFIAK